MNIFSFNEIEPVFRGKGEHPLTSARVIHLLKKHNIWFGLDSSNRPWTTSTAIDRAIELTGHTKHKATTNPTTPEIKFL